MKDSKFVIDLPPVTKKNHQRIMHNPKTRRLFIAQSQQYVDYEKAALWFLKPEPKEPIDRPVEVKCLFYMPTWRLCDLTNLLEAVDDILVRGKVLKDDNYKIIVSHDGSRVYVDREHPRTEIYITELEE